MHVQQKRVEVTGRGGRLGSTTVFGLGEAGATVTIGGRSLACLERVSTLQRARRLVEALSKRVPIGHIGKPTEVVGTIALLSDAASWVTGSDTVIDGGWKAW